MMGKYFTNLGSGPRFAGGPEVGGGGGGGGGCMPPFQFLANQLALFQLGEGADYAHCINVAPPPILDLPSPLVPNKFRAI